MKVTQKEFDAKRKELNEVQGKKLNVRERIDILTRFIDTYKVDIGDSQEDYSALAEEEFNVRAWLEDVWIEEDLSVDLEGCKLERSGKAAPYIDVRSFGKYKHKAYHLDGLFTWNLLSDEDGDLVLFPTKKPNKP